MEKGLGELLAYRKTTHDEILNLENDVSSAKQAYEKKKRETAEMQLQVDSILQVAASKTLARGQVTIWEGFHFFFFSRDTNNQQTMCVGFSCGGDKRF